MSQQGGAQPGWYERPDTPGAVRYWDGRRWTDNLAPKSAFPRQGGQDVPDGLLVAGYITMLLLPFVGAIIGIIVLTKGDGKAGGWILGVSVACMVAGFLMFSGFFDSDPTYYGGY